jgi:putative transposase
MYARYRFPTEIISYTVWLYFAFPLSYRDVQKLLLYRGIDVSHEAIRAWCNKFGQQYAKEIRRRPPRVSDKWHLDKVVVTINGEKY